MNKRVKKLVVKGVLLSMVSAPSIYAFASNDSALNNKVINNDQINQEDSYDGSKLNGVEFGRKQKGTGTPDFDKDGTGTPGRHHFDKDATGTPDFDHFDKDGTGTPDFDKDGTGTPGKHHFDKDATGTPDFDHFEKDEEESDRHHFDKDGTGTPDFDHSEKDEEETLGKDNKHSEEDKDQKEDNKKKEEYKGKFDFDDNIDELMDYISKNGQIEVNMKSNKHMLDNKIFKTIKNVNGKVKFYNGDGSKWTFDGQNIDKNFADNIDLSVQLDNKDAVAKVKKIAKDAQSIHFNYHGQLPGEADVEVNIGKDNQLNNKNLSLYYLDEEKNKVSKVDSNIVPDATGEVSMKIDHCSDYFLSADSSLDNAPIEIAQNSDVAADNKQNSDSQVVDNQEKATGSNTADTSTVLGFMMSMAGSLAGFMGIKSKLRK